MGSTRDVCSRQSKLEEEHTKLLGDTIMIELIVVAGHGHRVIMPIETAHIEGSIGSEQTPERVTMQGINPCEVLVDNTRQNERY